MNNISRTFFPPPLRPQRFPVPGVSRGIKGGHLDQMVVDGGWVVVLMVMVMVMVYQMVVVDVG